MQTRPRKIACSPLYPFFPWTSAINPVMQRASLWWKEQAFDANSKPVMQIAIMWCKYDRDRPSVINWCICCIIIFWAECDHTFYSLSHQPPLQICPRALILLLLPHRFISTPPPFKSDWCQGTKHCTHDTCQARIIQPTLTSPTSTSL